MAFCRMVFPLLVLNIIACYATNVPVYMWGDLPEELRRANPLTTTTEEQFAELLPKELAGRLVVVFLEETLSVEDFSRRNVDGETSFPYLHSKLSEADYLPAVTNPQHVLETLADGSETNIDLTVDNELNQEVLDKSSGNFVFINLKDAHDDESRASYLRRHDEFISKTMSKLQENGDKVVAIYTARYPSWAITDAPVTHSRVRRATSKSLYSELNGLRLYATSISLVSRNQSIPLTTVVSTNTAFNEEKTEMNTSMVYENDTSITLNFDKKGGYWFFESVTLSLPTLTEVLHPVDEVYAIEGFSYRCAQYVRFASVNDSMDYTLNFQDIKVQPFFENTNASTPFGDSLNCVGFFSAPIWAALFVTFILLTITFYGIMMMMDIRTMDRFDDPKGKTITINTAE